MTTQENFTDFDEIEKLEYLILYALDYKFKSTNQLVIRTDTFKKSNTVGELISVNGFHKFNDMFPSEMYTIDFNDKGRIFSAGYSDLLQHPSEILNDQSEVIIMSDDAIKWTGVKRMDKLPKHMIPIGTPSHIYQLHFRKILLATGQEYYEKRIIPVSEKGRPLFLNHRNVAINQNSDGVSFILMCSIIEDAKRTNSVLASVTDGITLKFPVSYDAYKEVFSIRDAPLSDSGKRKAIIHWVAKHIRSTKKSDTVVKQHLRGVSDIRIGNMLLNLTPNNII